MAEITGTSNSIGDDNRRLELLQHGSVSCEAAADKITSLRQKIREKIIADKDKHSRASLCTLLVNISRWEIRKSIPTSEMIDDLTALVSAEVLRSDLIDCLTLEAERVSLFLERRSIPGRIRRMCLGSIRIATWTGLVTALLIGILLLGAAYLFSNLLSEHSVMPIGAFAALMLGGFLGSAVSIAMKTESVPDHAAIDPAQIYLSTVVRPLIGSLFGLLLFCVLKLGIIKIVNWSLPDDPDLFSYACWLIGFISGFSERLVPDVIRRTETTLGGAMRSKLASSEEK
jgi:hypothetical protein